MTTTGATSATGQCEPHPDASGTFQGAGRSTLPPGSDAAAGSCAQGALRGPSHWLQHRSARPLTPARRRYMQALSEACRRTADESRASVSRGWPRTARLVAETPAGATVLAESEPSPVRQGWCRRCPSLSPSQCPRPWKTPAPLLTPRTDHHTGREAPSAASRSAQPGRPRARPGRSGSAGPPASPRGPPRRPGSTRASLWCRRLPPRRKRGCSGCRP